ncbi:hypothetical protein [Chryseolinea lacunae]|uniref:CBM6 domain-containing protein n=1 Tax=Chryseolinea lacunae TaxID=2801331 RepID=A0ABS1KYT1_9BACT|nr:hypothetical protein [Chryseolinea lacunae]MBL0744610.1 hypothetical protein [Chryseolinea lacunae]
MMKFTVACLALMTISLVVVAQKPSPGKAWEKTPQTIPGRVQCEFYDVGGEGVAYHDTDSINNGSGKLNPPNGDFFNMFRLKEGVDISYTKDNNIDNTPYNTVQPDMKQLYVGWTQPGEWVRYSVNVKTRGDYLLSIMYTSHDNGHYRPRRRWQTHHHRSNHPLHLSRRRHRGLAPVASLEQDRVVGKTSFRKRQTRHHPSHRGRR